MEEHGGELTYDALMDMDYLNAVIHEDLRINGPVHQRFRVCTKDTEVCLCSEVWCSVRQPVDVLRVSGQAGLRGEGRLEGGDAHLRLPLQ